MRQILRVAVSRFFDCFQMQFLLVVSLYDMQSVAKGHNTLPVDI